MDVQFHADPALPAQAVPTIALAAQSCDEFRHLAACDLTYEGRTRAMLRRWLEDKEHGRAPAFLGRAVRPACAAEKNRASRGRPESDIESK